MWIKDGNGISWESGVMHLGGADGMGAVGGGMEECKTDNGGLMEGCVMHMFTSPTFL